MNNQPKRKKNKPVNMTGKWLIRIPLIIVIIVVIALVLIVLREGSIKAAFRSGITLQPSVTEVPHTVPSAESPTEVTEETEASTEPSSEPADPVMEQAQQYLDSMTLEQKLCQMILTTPDGITGVYGAARAVDGTRAALEQYPVGGLIYERQNMQTIGQLTEMISNSQSYSSIPLFIGVAEEGGNNAPLTSIGLTAYYSNMSVYGQEENVTRISEIGGEMAEDLLSVGFNFNLAPVADVLTDPYDTEIGNRSFGSDAALTSELTATMLRSLQDGGVTACLKYFPGLASGDGDSSFGQAVSQRSLEELRQEELLPFAAGIDAGARMIIVSHMSLPQVVGDDTPCDLSYEIVTKLLRLEMGYEGLILTDSHEKAAITNYYDCGDAAVAAVLAGCDMILQPESLEEAVSELLAAVADGRISEERINESVLRILYLKIQMGLI